MITLARFSDSHSEDTLTIVPVGVLNIVSTVGGQSIVYVMYIEGLIMHDISITLKF